MTYHAPLREINFILEDLCNLSGLSALDGFEDFTPETIEAILLEAGKFANDVLAPLNHQGDVDGLGFKDGKVTMPRGWKEAYTSLVEAGWNSPAAEPEFGGMGLPVLVNTCIQELFNGANISFQLCPLLTQGAIEALAAYADPALQAVYLEKMVSGEWAGTMNLTEPQAGSDLSQVRSKAVPKDDHYLISGQKIFITYGEHDMVDNIVHLVLARLPDAPEGTKGISLFVVPKFLPDADGQPGVANDLRCVSIEHKLGIHASPTCTMAYGDNEGAIGYLVGEPNRGLQYMFAMMNNARLNVGLQGIGVAEHAFQTAAYYASERKQGAGTHGTSPAPIIQHPDVKRMLGVMKAQTEGARILALRAALSIDMAERVPDADIRARHQRRVDLLIPVVKAWSTEMAVSVASQAVQVHGGMGYVEETGVAQFYRDAKITTIYEGTTGIQAMDLVGRKILRDQGLAVSEIVSDIRASANALSDEGEGALDVNLMRRSAHEAADLIEKSCEWLLAAQVTDAALPLAAAQSVMDVFGMSLSAWCLIDSAAAASRHLAVGDGDAAFWRYRISLAECFIHHIFPMAQARLTTMRNGSYSVIGLEPDMLAQAS